MGLFIDRGDVIRDRDWPGPEYICRVEELIELLERNGFIVSKKEKPKPLPKKE